MKRFDSPAFLPGQAWVGLASIGLIGLCFLAFFNQLGTLGLMDKTEGLFAEVPRQMLLQGDWVTPRWNGETFFDYPVWGYWMVALSFRTFGISEWAARLPAAIAASFTVLALFGTVFKLGSDAEPLRQRLGRATLAGSLLALSPGWIAWGRSSVTDMFLASAITLALLGFVLVYQSNLSAPSNPFTLQHHLGYGILSLFSAIAVLAKGPVGLLLPGLVILLFLLLKGQLPFYLRQAPWLPMLALFLGVTLPWYWLATVANGFDFLSRFLGYSNFQRFTSVIYSHPGPPWFYLPWVFLFLLPWSLYLPIALIRLRFWRMASWRHPASVADLPLFALVWLVCMVVFYSAAATKLAGYILPVVPAGVLLVCLLFQPFLPQPPLAFGARVTGWCNAGVLGLAAIAAALLPRFLKQQPDYPSFVKALVHTGLPIGLPLVFLLTLVGLLLILSSNQALSLLWLPNATALSLLLAVAVPTILPVETQ
ncbi:MAG: glycosyl transferase family 39 [Synechococcaceae bacterium WB9_2_170]|nr:glycosyl transferase family 39 [Synechococcaceae bacterium WB9_2_170]